MSGTEPEANVIHNNSFVTETLPIDNQPLTTHTNSQELLVEGGTAVNAARPFAHNEITRADEVALSKYKHPPSTKRSHFMTGGGKKRTSANKKSTQKKRATKPKGKPKAKTSKSSQNKKKQSARKKQNSKKKSTQSQKKKTKTKPTKQKTKSKGKK